LKALYLEDLLVFDYERGEWQWDLEEIGARGITDNVVELMAGRIKKTNEQAQNALKLAACIGNEFELETLSLVCEASPQETVRFLWDAVDEGLVVPLGNDYKAIDLESSELSDLPPVRYRFCHDRIQQAAYSLIADTDRPSVHWWIGTTLLESTPQAMQEERIFDIANQLNQGSEPIDGESWQYRLAGLNLRAGERAKASAAFEPAFEYMQTGLKRLSEKSWQEDYDLTLRLHAQGVQAAYLVSEYEEMERLASLVLKYARTLLDKVGVYDVKIQAYFATGRLLEGVDLGLQLLRLLGVRIPRHPGKLRTIAGLARTELSILGRRIEDLINVPEMTDPIKRAAMHTLATAGTPIYYSAPELIPFIPLVLVRLTAKYGYGSLSPFAFATYALVLCGALGRIEAGYRFGRLAVEFLKNLDTKEQHPRTLFLVNFFTRHWKEHPRDTLKPFLDSYQDALEVGDFEYASLSTYAHGLFSYFIGRELGELEREMALTNVAMRQMKQDTTLNHGLLVRQAMLNLLGRSEDPSRLVGESYDEDRILPIHYETHETVALFHVFFH
ncbi:PAS sensor protein, partial [Thermodesulfobacteriota bacterium]